MNSHIQYFYRDGANDRAYPDEPVIAAGELPEDEIRPCLRSGEQFIPGDVGLPELQSQLEGFPSRDDHVWHELVAINYVGGQGSSVEGPDDKNHVENRGSTGPGPEKANGEERERTNSEEPNLSEQEVRRREILERGEPTVNSPRLAATSIG